MKYKSINVLLILLLYTSHEPQKSIHIFYIQYISGLKWTKVGWLCHYRITKVNIMKGCLFQCNYKGKICWCVVWSWFTTSNILLENKIEKPWNKNFDNFNLCAVVEWLVFLTKSKRNPLIIDTLSVWSLSLIIRAIDGLVVKVSRLESRRLQV